MKRSWASELFARWKKWIIKFGEKRKPKGKTGKVVKSCSRKRECLLYTKKVVKPDFSFSQLWKFLINASQQEDCSQRFLYFFIINMRSLKSERIDSTETTIS